MQNILGINTTFVEAPPPKKRNKVNVCGGVNEILALLGCYPTSVTSYKSKLRNIAEERRSQSNFVLAMTVPDSHSCYETSCLFAK
jgi:hypothetical protein